MLARSHLPHAFAAANDIQYRIGNLQLPGTRFMHSFFKSTIASRLEKDGSGKGYGRKLFPFFIHREDSEPDRVAPRNRLAQTQPLSSSTGLRVCPTEYVKPCLFRSSSFSHLGTQAIEVAMFGDRDSRPEQEGKDTPSRQQQKGRQTDGFRRTISHEKNSRGVRENLT